MSKYYITITEPAELDLHQIAAYITKELQEPELAYKLVGKIGEAILSLEEMPHRNGLVSDERLALQSIRKILIDNYIVFYVVNDESKTVIIIRILCGRRDWMSLL